MKNESAFKCEEEKKAEKTYQFYLKRLKNSKIPDEFKIRLVLDSKKSSFNISDIWRMYFIWESTVRSILKEIADIQSLQWNSEIKLRKRNIEQLHVKIFIDEFLWST